MNFDPRTLEVVMYELSPQVETSALPVNSDGLGISGAEQVRFPRKRGHVEQPVLRPASSQSTQQFNGQHSGTVRVSAVLVEVTREQVDQPVSTVPHTDR